MFQPIPAHAQGLGAAQVKDNQHFLKITSISLKITGTAPRCRAPLPACFKLLDTILLHNLECLWSVSSPVFWMRDLATGKGAKERQNLCGWLEISHLEFSPLLCATSCLPVPAPNPSSDAVPTPQCSVIPLSVLPPWPSLAAWWLWHIPISHGMAAGTSPHGSSCQQLVATPRCLVATQHHPLRQSLPQGQNHGIVKVEKEHFRSSSPAV